MAFSLYLYTVENPDMLAQVMERHQKSFQILLEDSFSDAELDQHRILIDELAGVWPQNIIEELTFDDLPASPSDEKAQREFFNKCQGVICLENTPFLENNPFQVTYLIELLKNFSQVLIDRGDELIFQMPWLRELSALKGMESLFTADVYHEKPAPLVREMTPVDRIVGEIYTEIKRLRAQDRLPDPAEMAEKRQRIYQAVIAEECNADQLLSRCGLIPKDFGDGLEGLKFFLKKII